MGSVIPNNQPKRFKNAKVKKNREMLGTILDERNPRNKCPACCHPEQREQSSSLYKAYTGTIKEIYMLCGINKTVNIKCLDFDNCTVVI